MTFSDYSCTISQYAMLIVALLQLHLKQMIVDKTTEKKPADRLSKTDEKSNAESDGKKIEKSKKGLIERTGEKLKKYWKIGIGWLVALKEWLSKPFDERVIDILNSCYAIFVPIFIEFKITNHRHSTAKYGLARNFLA